VDSPAAFAALHRPDCLKYVSLSPRPTIAKLSSLFLGCPSTPWHYAEHARPSISVLKRSPPTHRPSFRRHGNGSSSPALLIYSSYLRCWPEKAQYSTKVVHCPSPCPRAIPNRGERSRFLPEPCLPQARECIPSQRQQPAWSLPGKPKPADVPAHVQRRAGSGV
jgi:hypothetical protein